MSKGQKGLQQQATQRSTEQYGMGKDAEQRLVTGSKELNDRKELVAGRRKSITDGTLRDSKDFISNAANVAAREQDRETRANLTKTGVAGLASNYADPTQIALADKMNKDEFARDSAAQTEADANDYIKTTEAMEDDLIRTNIGVDQGVMNSAFGNSNANMQMASQIAAQRASILPSIIGMAIGGAAQVATGTNWFQRGGGGGGGSIGVGGKG